MLCVDYGQPMADGDLGLLRCAGSGVGAGCQPWNPEQTAFRLEIWMDGESPIGRAYDERGASREFAGWTSLDATIDHLIAAAQPGSGPHHDERLEP
jgi:hypothetical protein